MPLGFLKIQDSSSMGFALMFFFHDAYRLTSKRDAAGYGIGTRLEGCKCHLHGMFIFSYVVPEWENIYS